MSALTDAMARLNGYNSNNFDAVSNPLGFGADGHRTNFPAALKDVATAALEASAAILAAADIHAASLSGGGLVIASATDTGAAGSLAAKIVDAEIINPGGSETISLAKAMKRAAKRSAIIFG